MRTTIYYGSPLPFHAAIALKLINCLLRLAILGLTNQYLSAAITRDQYEAYHTVFNNEVGRLNPPLTTASKGFGDDAGVQPSTELRFPLLRKWNLYEAMFHSGYVANKLAVWHESGISKLNRLLTKMGYVVHFQWPPHPAHCRTPRAAFLRNKPNKASCI